MPEEVLIPVLNYESVSEAVAWPTRAFGLTLRWQIEEHRAQLGVGRTAAIAITNGSVPDGADHVMVRVDDVDAHQARAAAAGVSVSEANDHMYGERQYAATDFSGRRWLFTESLANLAPSDWVHVAASWVRQSTTVEL